MPHANSAPSPAASGGATELERLSAWIDGESRPTEAAPLLDQILARDELRRSAREWVLCGDAMRSHETAADLASGHDARVLSRVSQALQAEPALLAPRALLSPHAALATRRNLAMAGAAVAAVAVLSLVVVPQMRREAVTGEFAQAGSVPGAAATQVASLAAAAPPVRASRASGQGAGQAFADPALDPYFLAHGSFATGGVMPAAAVYLRHGPVEGQ